MYNLFVLSRNATKSNLLNLVKPKLQPESFNILFFVLVLSYCPLAITETVNNISNYFDNVLKSKPIATYSIPKKLASVEVDISKATNFNWDKAVIFGSFDYKARICYVLQLDNNECDKHDFDSMVKSENYFIVFVHEHKVIYKEIFNDELLLFGINTIGKVLKPDKALISIYRDETKKILHDRVKLSQYFFYSSLVICPILGVLFGLRFPKISLIFGVILIVPECLLIWLVRTSEGNIMGAAMLSMFTAPAFLGGLGMYIGSAVSIIKVKRLSKIEHTERIEAHRSH